MYTPTDLYILHGGQKFGRLTVCAFPPRTKGEYPLVEVLCDCGTKKTVRWSNVLSGNTRSCGPKCRIGRPRTNPAKESVAEFCRRQGISRQTYYNLLHAQEGPP